MVQIVYLTPRIPQTLSIFLSFFDAIFFLTAINIWLVYNLFSFPGLPLALSKGHFLGGDPELFDRIEGLKPEKKIHDSHLTIEPVRTFLFIAFCYYFISIGGKYRQRHKWMNKLSS